MERGKESCYHFVHGMEALRWRRNLRSFTSPLRVCFGTIRFTLVQPLVVIALVGFLAALLLSSYPRGKSKSVTAVCLNNLLRIGIGSYFCKGATNKHMSARLSPIANWLDLARKANWSVNEMAKLCNVSARTLQLHFLKAIGETPKNWMVRQRQIQAIGLLNSGASVKEAAAKLGYKHAHHFSREFKKISGHSPTRLKKV